MRRALCFSLVMAFCLVSGVAVLAQASPCVQPEPDLGSHLFALGWAMGWAEINSLQNIASSTFLPDFERTRAAARDYGYPADVVAEMDAILNRVRSGARTRDVYERIRDLRIRMQENSANWFACGHTGGSTGQPPPPPPPPPGGCDQPLSCGFCLGSGIRNKWLAMGGEGSVLGCPIMNEADAARSPQGTTGRYAEFRGGDGGYIFWHGSGAKRGNCYEVHGCFVKLYKNYGGTTSWLGFPVSDGHDAPGGARQDFEGGYLTWDLNTRQCSAHKVDEEAKNPLIGRWRGQYKNTKGQTGPCFLTIYSVTGSSVQLETDEGKYTAYLDGDTLTWEARNTYNNCRDYRFKVVFSPDRQSAMEYYDCFADRCDKPSSYSGTAPLTKSE